MTPLMRQYWDIKSAHNDKILFFRMGDFFEMFFDDAVTAAPILGIALTSRNKKSGDETPMCGMPHHSIPGPINKLLQEGHKVAICDQVEDPKQAKGIVKRAVTRILSPGMVFDPETLEGSQANYLCCYDELTISFLETTTGEAFYYSLRTVTERDRLIEVLNPVELVVNEKEKERVLNEKGLEGPHLTVYTEVGENVDSSLPQSAQVLLSYAVHMQGDEVLSTLRPFEEKELVSRLELTPTVLRHLEILESYRGERKGTLFHSINRTKTAIGARLLKNWLCFPLIDVQKIKDRQEQIAIWQKDMALTKEVRKVLFYIGDIERRLGKISNPGCNPRDLIALRNSLQAGQQAVGIAPHFRWNEEALRIAQLIDEEISTTLIDEPPVSARDGFFVQKGFSANLDELIQLSESSQSLLREMEEREKEKTQIPSLKIRYNQVFGYYIEVTKKYSDDVPERYQRKQTLTNAERYTTEELKQLEDKVLSAKSRRAEVEYQVFSNLRQTILEATASLLTLTRQLSELDVHTALAWLAIEQQYVKPEFSNHELNLKGSRHPVVEQEMQHPFVPNEISLPNRQSLLLTGPNMAGKSTLMRQVAVTAILAQMGSFVPAKSAVLPIFDRIFTRIGASDFLSEGLSTFMVEMKETAEMLKEATPHSLVILDEIGRGTSTYDGMSLAQSILEYLLTKSQAMTLFATHYHELTQLEGRFPQLVNGHMSIVEKRGDIQFLHTLMRGPANKSYGIQVARLAGIPTAVTKRATTILNHLESAEHAQGQQMSLLDMATGAKEVHQEVLLEEESVKLSPEEQKLLETIRELPVQTMTPIEALNQIVKWQEHLS